MANKIFRIAFQWQFLLFPAWFALQTHFFKKPSGFMSSPRLGGERSILLSYGDIYKIMNRMERPPPKR